MCYPSEPFSIFQSFKIWKHGWCGRFNSRFFLKTGWPSGLRRWIKAPISSGAWVRIPLQSHFSAQLTKVEKSEDEKCYRSDTDGSFSDFSKLKKLKTFFKNFLEYRIYS